MNAVIGSNAEIELLTEALIHYSEGYTEGDVTVRVCWDPDRLNLGRVGIEPKPDSPILTNDQTLKYPTAPTQRHLWPL